MRLDVGGFVSTVHVIFPTLRWSRRIMQNTSTPLLLSSMRIHARKRAHTGKYASSHTLTTFEQPRTQKQGKRYLVFYDGEVNRTGIALKSVAMDHCSVQTKPAPCNCLRSHYAVLVCAIWKFLHRPLHRETVHDLLRSLGLRAVGARPSLYSWRSRSGPSRHAQTRHARLSHFLNAAHKCLQIPVIVRLRSVAILMDTEMARIYQEEENPSW